MEEKPLSLFTIGYSTHSIDEFIGLLKNHGITAIADVRSHPYSRIHHFNHSTLHEALKAEGIEYVFLGRELGARREEQECYLDGQAKYNLIAELPLFNQGIIRLQKGAKKYSIALMCAEKEPLDCHRTILISRHLRRLGFRIQHILADGCVEDHKHTERRLLQRMNTNSNLFEQTVSESELLERAYDERSREIAYTKKKEHNQND